MQVLSLVGVIPRWCRVPSASSCRESLPVWVDCFSLSGPVRVDQRAQVLSVKSICHHKPPLTVCLMALASSDNCLKLLL